jgi:hypothetical protein
MSDYIAATTTVDSVNHLLTFDSEGYYVVGDEKWQDITFTTTLVYSGGTIGIAPRIYDTNMYMYLHLYNDVLDDTTLEEVGVATLDAQITYTASNIAQARIAPLVVGTEYRFKVEIRGTNYRISLNDQVIFNIEYPGMSRGKVGVYSSTGNSCKDIEVQSLFAEGWTTNITSVKGAVAGIRELENEDKYLYLYSPISTSIVASQTRTVIGGTDHTLSFNYSGSGTARVREMNGAEPQTLTFVLADSADWTRESFTHPISADCTSVTIDFYTNNSRELMVNGVQLEDKSFATGYIHNESTLEAKVRENSIITYPAKENIKPELGSLVMWFNPSITYNMNSQFKPVLFEHGTESPLRISYENGELTFTYGEDYVGQMTDLLANTWYNLVATWSEDRIQLYLNGVLAQKEGTFAAPPEAKLIHIGNTVDVSKNLFYGAIDETIVLSSVLTLDEVEEIGSSLEPVADNSSMIMRATFNYAIANFNKSIIEATLSPDYGSPVLVEKADGAEMRKVSFFDFYTGEYRTFNEEVVEYDKTLDYVEISYHDKDVDQESFAILVEDAEGIKYGSPYELRGRKLYLNLEDTEKESLDGQLLYVTYQLEDSYTVDFNIGVPDSFRITLGKHDGQPVRVIYEGNGFTDEKLLTMVELNPMLNPNHEGFLYITRNDEKVTSFRIKATPEDLPANGGSEALVTVEPLDANGNYVSHCTLEVSADLGEIIPAYDEESIKLRDRAGRFLYRYRSPILSSNQIKGVEIQDNVNVIDKETGIGVQAPIILTALQERDHVIAAGDTIEKIAEKYGSTIEDIAYTEDMMAKVKAKYGTSASGEAVTRDKVIADARVYVLNSVGQTIKIPINYSSRHLQESQLAKHHDTMIAYLTEMVASYMNKPAKNLPEGLGSLLDFNGDGMINILEISWLQLNRLTTVLQEKYDAVVDWDNAN